MRLIDKTFILNSRSDRVEIFPFYDCHIGKRNCYEHGIIKQRQEILAQAAKPGRQCCVIMGGDILDVISPKDIRFDFNEVADWVLEGDADNIRDKLNDIARGQVKRGVELFEPIKHLILGNLEANHEKAIRRYCNTDVHKQFCDELGIEDLTDECVIRLIFKRKHDGLGIAIQVVKLFMRHGYGSGRSAGAEAMKVAQMMADGVAADCDVCLTGHTHSFYISPPVPVLYIPNRGKLPPELLLRYRYGLNPGCWLLSHKAGKGTYESQACYATRPIMTTKIVIWPFWGTSVQGYKMERPKIEIRNYTIL